MNRDELHLTFILDCIDRIESYCVDGRQAFLADECTQDAVVRRLQIIAESTQRISEHRKASQPQIDWRGIAGFRNVLVHDYLGIDVERVWQIVETYLPDLKEAIQDMR